jgi:uncharacterized delta-60 repeat protein
MMNSLPRRTLALACVSFLSVLTIFILSASRAQAGALDTTFGSGGGSAISVNANDYPVRVFVLSDGKILIAGESVFVGVHILGANPILARLNSNGTLDSSFGSSGVVNGSGAGNATVEDAILQPDGKIVLVGGANPSYNQPPLDFAVERFNSDGSRDTTFGGGTGYVITSIGGSYDSASAIVYLPGGKLLAAGSTRGTMTSPGALDFVRYNSDGSLDQTFGDGGILYYLLGQNNSWPAVYDMKLLPDGKLLLTGNNAAGGDFLARVNPDGSFDTTFGTNGFVYSGYVRGRMTIQPDGKIIIPFSSSINDNGVFAMARFNPDGSLDNAFGVSGIVQTPWRSNLSGFANASASQAFLKSNGEIILVGSVVRINGQIDGRDTSAVGAADYTGNGTLIAKTAIAFPPYQSYGRTGAVQPDGKIIVAGYNDVNFSDIVLARLTTITNDARRYKRFFDFNGDLYTDLMIYRPGVGSTPSVWYNFNASISPTFGQEGDIITPADYNDDGVTDLAVFRPSNGTWYIASDNNDPINHFTAIQWGASGDIPVAGDYDGDGKADVGVFRPSNGYWYILYSGDNTAKIVPFGVSGDKPVVGDYDGDGRCDLAVFRPSNGTWYVANIATGEYQIVQFGANGDIPAQNDFNGDGKTDMVIFRPSTGIWYTSTDPATNYGAVQFGRNGDIPVVGDYDADGKADIAVWRPTNRSWYVRRSTNGSVLAQQWGATTDIPVPGN